MFQLVYVSHAAWPMDPNDLNDILDVSRRNNVKADVSGLLLYLDQSFLQVLEGPIDAVIDTFGRIAHDPRHDGVRLLVQQHVPERLFDGWGMGFDRPSLRTPDLFHATQEAITHVVAPEKAALIAAFLRNFYRINSGDRAA